MLRRLHIRDYLLIEELELELGDGLTIITGETGSGKSILLGALGLVMGERADAASLRDPARRCIIELEADLGDLGLEPWFAAQELPYEDRTLLRRQLEPGGRSRAFINDTPVRLEQLRELGGQLVHVHSQHQALLLNDPAFQLRLLDDVAGQAVAAGEYALHHRAWRQKAAELEALRADHHRLLAEEDFLRHQLEELDAAGLRPGEQAEVEERLNRAEHASDLLLTLRTLEEGLRGEQGVLDALARLARSLASTARYDTGSRELHQRIEQVRIELNDLAGDAARLAGSVELDPAASEQLRQRLDLLLRLQQKHRVNGVEELIALRESMARRVLDTGSLGQRIETLAGQVEGLAAEVRSRAGTLSQARRAALEPLARQVQGVLQQLGMPKAVFALVHEPLPEPGPQGIDRVQAMFSANAGRAPLPLDKAASGGELARVMLALISLLAGARGLPTVVLDEIDTGVSGATAHRVGELLARMARQRQVIAITHLPQIASKAGRHLLVSKQASGGQTRTAIEPVEHERRVEALARMLSGRKLTREAMENARTLLKGG